MGRGRGWILETGWPGSRAAGARKWWFPRSGRGRHGEARRNPVTNSRRRMGRRKVICARSQGRHRRRSLWPCSGIVGNDLGHDHETETYATGPHVATGCKQRPGGITLERARVDDGLLGREVPQAPRTCTGSLGTGRTFPGSVAAGKWERATVGEGAAREAGVAELAYAADLKSAAARHEGSNPSPGTSGLTAVRRLPGL